VIGPDVPLPLLLAIAEAPQPQVRTELTHLQAAEFLYETRLFPDLEYTFKHALTHEVAYQGLLHDRQRALHARITEAIERLAPERGAEQAERLAHHAVRGELWAKAVAYLRQAGLRAMAGGANRQAIPHLEQALGALRRLPETRETTELTIDLHVDLRNALFALGELARMGEHLRAAEGLARTLGDPHRLGRIATFMVGHCVLTGDYDEAARFGPEALTIARTLGDRSIEVVATNFLGLTHLARGEFSDATSLFERNLALEGDHRLERFGTPGIQWALSGASLATVLAELGRFDEAIGHAEAAVQIAEAADHPFTRLVGLLALGLAHLRRADLPHATRILERGQTSAARGISSSGHHSLPLPSAPPTLSAAGLTRRSHWSRMPSRSSAFVRFTTGRRSFCCARGRPISGPGGSMRPEVSPKRRWRSPVGWGPEPARATPSASPVTSRRRAALRTPKATTTRAWRSPWSSGCAPSAHCYLGLGKLYRRTGDQAKAHEHLTTGTTMYREMGMNFWLDKAEAEQKA